MATTRRKIANAEEAERLLDKLSVSDVDGPTFCQQEGIDGRSLNCWRLNLARRPPVGTQGRPEELRVVEVAWPGALAAAVTDEHVAPGGRSGGLYRVSVADAVIEVDDAFRGDTLARLLAVVRAC